MIKESHNRINVSEYSGRQWTLPNDTVKLTFLQRTRLMVPVKFLPAILQHFEPPKEENLYQSRSKSGELMLALKCPLSGGSIV
jgi:hypothetical protein